MSSASNEIIWFRRPLRELGAPVLGSPPLFAYSTSAFRIATNSVFHERTKHVKFDCHFIREQVVAGTHLPHIASYY